MIINLNSKQADLLLILSQHLGSSVSKRELKALVTTNVSLVVSKTLEKALEQKLKHFVTLQMLTDKLKQVKANAESGQNQQQSPKSIAEAILAEPRLLQKLRDKPQVISSSSTERQQKLLIEELSQTVKVLRQQNEQLTTRVSALEQSKELKPPEQIPHLQQSFSLSHIPVQPSLSSGGCSSVYDLRAKHMILAAQLRQSENDQQRLMTAFGYQPQTNF
jgi:hypothetical protein